MEFVSLVTAIASVVLLIAVTVFIACCLFDVLWDEYEAWQKSRQARIEAELDAKSEQLRRTILSLAEDLASERDEASRELTRAMFLATGRTDLHRS